MSAYNTIQFSIDDGLAILRFNRPECLNAISATLRTEFLQILQGLAQGKTKARALLITGNGRAFCSGADLGDNNHNNIEDVDLGEALINSYHPILLELANLEMPVITAVNGIAAGAGMSFAISGDIVIAARSAYFLQAFVNIGLVPDSGSSFLLPRLVGNARATAMMMLGEKVMAETAYDWGMITEVVDDEQLEKRAFVVARQLANGPTTALSGIRRLMATSMKNTYAEQLHEEAVVQRKIGASKDCVEGVSAFLQKRSANFSGT